MRSPTPASSPTPLAPVHCREEMLAVDAVLWPFWMRPRPTPEHLAKAVAELTSAGWDYLVGNALRGGLEGDLLPAFAELGPSAVPGWVCEQLRLARRVGGSPRRGSPEERLLLASASTAAALHSSPGPELLPGAIERLDWSAVNLAAARAGLELCLYRFLRDRALSASLPPREWECLENRYRGAVSRASYIYQRMGEVLALLHGAGVGVLVLKEGSLPDLMYGALDRRVIGDLDLLIKPDELADADRRLRADGFAPRVGEKQDEEWFVRSHHHLAPLVRPGGRFKVELHRLPASARVASSVDSDLLWSRARRATIAGSPAWVPEWEDLIELMCLHVVNDGFVGKALDLCEVSNIAAWRGDRLDWDGLVEHAARGKASDAVRVVLRLARELFGAPLPAEIERALRRSGGVGRRDERLTEIIARRSLFERDHVASRVPSYYRKFAVRQLMSAKSSPAKYRALAARALGFS